ncbi:MAG: PEP-CTERM sorting domain-containing protein [Akkermansia sp.]|nr:PEP-CTERM sorting domain-containing protein [Akkermansia sp.]
MSEVAGNNSAFKGFVTTKTIPEPTTATLSLLALCGLAARRRRK